MASLGIRGPGGPAYQPVQSHHQASDAHTNQERPALPGISTLLESIGQGAPPTPASTNSSTAASPSDRAVLQRKQMELWEPTPDKRRRLEDHREEYPGYPHSAYPRRLSGASEYRRHPHDSPQAISSNSPPVSSSSYSVSHRPAFSANPPVSTPLPQSSDQAVRAPMHPTLPPLQQRPSPFGPPIENPTVQSQRWHTEHSAQFHSSAPAYAYGRERTIGSYDPHWGPAQTTYPSGYRDANTYDLPYHHNQVTFQPISAHGEGQIPRKRRGNLPKEATTILKKWYSDHSDSPYPTEDDKMMLCNRAQLSMNQVSNWFINARRRQPGRDGNKKSSASPNGRRTSPP